MLYVSHPYPHAEGPRLQTPVARELLGELAPGGALDPAAARRTPYVEQLLRTLPVLTPETGAPCFEPSLRPSAGCWKDANADQDHGTAVLAPS